MPRHLTAWGALVVGVAAAALTLVAHRTAEERAERSVETVLRAGYALQAPFAYRDADGHLRGEAVDTLQTVLLRAGLPKPIWVHVEFPRLIHELQSGRIDVIAAGMFITPERTAQVEFTRPTASTRTGLLVAQNNPLGLHALADLQHAGGGRLAVLDGSVAAVQAREAGLSEAQLLRLPDPASAVAALRSGQAVAFALSEPALRWAMRGLPGLELAAPFSVPRHGDLPDIGYPAFAFRKGDARRVRVDHALSGYLGSAEHLRLAAGYGFAAEDVAPALGMDPTAPPRKPGHE